jgi:general secretion pathway protein N
MMSQKRLLTIGLVTLLLGLLIFFPARVAYRWFLPDTISLAGISGSIWNGNAREAFAQGFYVRDLEWRMRPLALLSGGIGFAFEASPQTGFMDGNIKLGFNGQITFDELTTSLTLQELEPLIGLPGLGGTANAEFTRLVMDDGLPIMADGILEVTDLLVPSLFRGSIGGYRAEFFTQESGVMASVEDTDGVIDIAGSLSLLADGSYEFIAQIAPKNNTPESVRRQMQFLGSANERGQHELRLEGEFY